MLVTFHSKAWSNITMFGNVAVPLLRMMGHSGKVPGALLAADLPAALAQLQQQLTITDPPEKIKPEFQPDNDESDAPSIGLSLRAWPLIQLLYAAIEQGCDVGRGYLAGISNYYVRDTNYEKTARYCCRAV